MSTAYFQNPQNQYVEAGSTRFTWLWAFLFGPFFFAYKGIWNHALISFLLYPTLISWFVYADRAGALVRKHYLQRGWLVTEPPEQVPRERGLGAWWILIAGAAVFVGFTGTIAVLSILVPR